MTLINVLEASRRTLGGGEPKVATYHLGKGVRPKDKQAIPIEVGKVPNIDRRRPGANLRIDGIGDAFATAGNQHQDSSEQ